MKNMFLKHRYASLAVGVLSLAIHLSSCWPTYFYRLYDGPALPRDEIVILRAGVSVTVWSVDEKKITGKLTGNAAYELELLPGVHTIEVYVNWDQYGTTWKSFPKKVLFTSEAGHAYEVKIFLPGKPQEYKTPLGTTVKEYDWYPGIVDIDSNKIIAK